LALVRELPGFLVAVLLIAAVPGPALALLLRRAAIGGFGAAAPVVVGLETGIYLWVLSAGAGLAAAVAASSTAYTILRIVGGAVLVVLGLQAWRAALSRRTSGDTDPLTVDRGELPASRLLGRGRRGGYLVGLVTNLANPKAAVFTFAFYPQFIPHGYPLLPTAALLGLLQISVETALYMGFGLAVGRARTWFSRSVVRRRLDAFAGTVLIALGLRVATESR
jgi:threonine/homoserine/homoserine lactone efflux protein